jgi:hypothetical protein
MADQVPVPAIDKSAAISAVLKTFIGITPHGWPRYG